MTTALRLTFRLDRFAILLAGGVAALLALVGIAQALGLDGSQIPAACFGSSPPEGPLCSAYGTFVASSGLGGQLLAAFAIAPFAIGVVLGAPLLASEIEDGSAQMTWSLDRRTAIWPARRYLSMLAVVLVIATILATVGHLLEGALYPQWDPTASFHDFGARGVPLAVRAVAVLSAALLVGALIGRVLPALLLSAVLAGVLAWGLSTAPYPWLATVPTPEAQLDGSYLARGVVYISGGEALTFDEVVSRSPYEVDTRAFWSWVARDLELQSVAAPPSSYGVAVAGESLILLGASVLAVGAALVTVRRRSIRG